VIPLWQQNDADCNHFLAKMTVSRRDLPSMLPGFVFEASCDASWCGTAAFASSRNLRQTHPRL
jgi:hypothetical protein